MTHPGFGAGWQLASPLFGPLILAHADGSVLAEGEEDFVLLVPPELAGSELRIRVDGLSGDEVQASGATTTVTARWRAATRARTPPPSAR